MPPMETSKSSVRIRTIFGLRLIPKTAMLLTNKVTQITIKFTKGRGYNLIVLIFRF
uniref:Uncharacterized protein n=1 Tax=Anguilla anguilla TaxID=7936 RepID=A0A0E9UIX4_ANGAN